jgi:hypothetical protein
MIYHRDNIQSLHHIPPTSHVPTNVTCNIVTLLRCNKIEKQVMPHEKLVCLGVVL